jgi:hypothetical protein
MPLTNALQAGDTGAHLDASARHTRTCALRATSRAERGELSRHAASLFLLSLRTLADPSLSSMHAPDEASESARDALSQPPTTQTSSQAASTQRLSEGGSSERGSDAASTPPSTSEPATTPPITPSPNSHSLTVSKTERRKEGGSGGEELGVEVERLQLLSATSSIASMSACARCLYDGGKQELAGHVFVAAARLFAARSSFDREQGGGGGGGGWESETSCEESTDARLARDAVRCYRKAGLSLGSEYQMLCCQAIRCSAVGSMSCTAYHHFGGY